MKMETRCCSRCNGPLGSNLVGGLCAVCILEDALPTAESYTQSPNFGKESITRFGSFELLEEVGRGGMGVIYKARQLGLGRVVAIKLLLAGEFADTRARERLLREARTAAQLSHPGIVAIFEVGEIGGQPYFAMEYVPGPNLARACRDQPLSVATVVRYVEQLSRAVHYAHQQGVIHLDLKPANVLITPDDHPKLTDFGLTRSLIGPTRTVESAGSPNFMAPEQAESRLGSTGIATDVFGLGAILYYVLTGCPPATGESIGETLRAVVEREPLSPCALRPALPPDLATITLKCLEKNPLRRYSTALDVAEELNRWKNHKPIQARPASQFERAKKWARRKPAIAGLTLAVTFSLVGGLISSTWQWHRATRATDVARANELAARRQAYRAELLFMNEALGREDWSSIREALERTRPAHGDRDLRGWEWRFLWKVSRTEGTPFPTNSPGAIVSMALLEDGRTLAVGREESGFELWDLTASQRVYRYPDPINQVKDDVYPAGNVVSCRVAVVPGLGLLAFTDCQSPTNGWVRLWDVVRREVVRSFPIPHMPRHLAVSPDGTTIACSSMSGDGRVFMFETATGKLLRTLPSHPANFSNGTSLQFTADGEAVTVEDWDPSLPNGARRVLRIVDWRTGIDRHRLELGQDYSLFVAPSPDGHWLAVAAGFERGEVRVWDLASNRLVKALLGPGRTVHWARDSQQMWVGTRCWRVPDFTIDRIYDDEQSFSTTSALLPDGKVLITASDYRLMRWNVGVPPILRGGKVLDLDLLTAAVLPKDTGLILCGTNGQCYEAMVPDLTVRPVPPLGTGTVSVAIIQKSGQVIAGHKNGSITLHAPGTYAQTGMFDTGHGLVNRIRWMPRHKILAVQTGTNVLRPWLQAWDVEHQVRLWEVLPEVEGRGFAPNEHEGVLYQVFDDHLVGFDLMNRRIVRRSLDYSNAGRIKFSPDGRWMFSGMRGEQRVVDTRTWRTIDLLPLRRNNHGGSFWPNEPRMVLAPMRVVDFETGTDLLKLKTEFDFGTLPWISPDGGLIGVFADGFPRMAVWQAPTWEEIGRMEGTARRLAAFSK